jgi:hypothetical protein
MVVASMDVNSETRAAAVQALLNAARRPAELNSEQLVSIYSVEFSTGSNANHPIIGFFTLCVPCSCA